MRKYLSLILIVLCMCPLVYANSFEYDAKEFMTYSIANTTSGTQIFVIPATSIYPNKDRIIGWSITKKYDNTSNAEMFCEIYDADSSDVQISDEVIDEAEFTSYDTNGRFFIYPRVISYGIVVISGSNTVVQIFFER